MKVDGTPADENVVGIVTEYKCGCCKSVARERRVYKEEAQWPSCAATVGTTPTSVPSLQKARARTTIRVRIDANCLSDGKDRARSEVGLD